MTEEAGAERFGEFTTLQRNGRIVTVTFDRGDGLNALSRAAMAELTAVANRLGEDTENSVVVLTGRAAFSAGADLKDRDEPAAAPPTLLQRRQALKIGPALCGHAANTSAHDQAGHQCCRRTAQPCHQLHGSRSVPAVFTQQRSAGGGSGVSGKA